MQQPFPIPLLWQGGPGSMRRLPEMELDGNIAINFAFSTHERPAIFQTCCQWRWIRYRVWDREWKVWWVLVTIQCTLSMPSHSFMRSDLPANRENVNMDSFSALMQSQAFNRSHCRSNMFILLPERWWAIWVPSKENKRTTLQSGLRTTPSMDTLVLILFAC